LEIDVGGTRVGGLRGARPGRRQPDGQRQCAGKPAHDCKSSNRRKHAKVSLPASCHARDPAKSLASRYQMRNASCGAVYRNFKASETARYVRRPSWTLRPSRRWESSANARRTPLSASASTNGVVILLSANVEVRATAPGMLVTQ